MTVINPWTRYWESENLQSCLFTEGTEDEKHFIELWSNYSQNLSNDAKIIDLATGNGYLPSLLIKSNSTFDITGVDKAKIPDVIKQNKLFQLRDEVALEKLPFKDAEFDAATSLFGLEYSDPVLSYAELGRVLKPKASFCFLMHHSESELIRGSKAKSAEMLNLRQRGGLLDVFGQYLLGGKSEADVQAAGEIYLSQEICHSKEVRSEVARSIDAILTVADKDTVHARNLGNQFFLGFDAYHSRLMQMLKAAKTVDEIQKIKFSFAKNKLYVENIDEFIIKGTDSQALIAWEVKGIKEAF